MLQLKILQRGTPVTVCIDTEQTNADFKKGDSITINDPNKFPQPWNTTYLVLRKDRHNLYVSIEPN